MTPLQDHAPEMDCAAGAHPECLRKNVDSTTLHFPLSPRKISRLKSPLPPWDKVRARDDLSIEAMPPLPLLSTTERCKSEQTACRRRRIFGGMIKDYSSPSIHFSPLTQSPRKVIDINRFTPSPKFLHDAGERYQPITQLPSSYAFLPTVPTPLKRFYLEDGSAACLPGTYPMNKLPSILRQSSYRKLPGVSDEGQQDEIVVTEASLESLNLTTSVRCHPKDNSRECNDEDTAPSTPSQTSFGGNRVMFDPRITVIEYKNDFQRQWISYDELERFKRETVSLAENYLRQHPELIEKYSTPIKDSVTCTLRRRALYSLPVMSHCDDCDDQDLNVGGECQT